jgi:hypothetical protein
MTEHQTQSAPANSRAVEALAAAAILLTLCAMAWMRWRDPGANGPLNSDEFTSLEYYTSAGLEPSGQPRPIRRIEDYRTLPPQSFRQMAMGVYRSLGAWIDTNNHVPHSFLLNLAASRGAPTEAMLRLPAFLAALAFALAVYALLRFVLRWRYSAPLAALWAFSLPYMIRYGSEARGYSLMLLLQVLFLAFAYKAARQPASIRWGVAQAVTAILCCMNIVSLAVDWLLPAYAVLWCFPPAFETESTPPEQRKLWHRNLAIQAIGIGAVGFVFLCDRLPYVAIRAGKHGIPFADAGDLLVKGKEFLYFLFPGAEWIALGCLGLAGIAWLCCSRQYRWLGLICAATICVSVTHFCLVKRLTYPRTCGYCLPLVVIGAGYVVERIAVWAKGKTRLAVLTAAVGLTGALAFQSIAFHLDYYFDYPGALRDIDRKIVAENASAVYCVGPSADYCMTKYLPAKWLTAGDAITSDSKIGQVVFFVSAGTPDGKEISSLTDTLPPHARGNFHGSAVDLELLGATPPQNTTPLGRFRLAHINVRVEPFTPEQQFPGKAPIVVVWYPEPARVPLVDSSVAEVLLPAGVPFLPRARYFPADLSFYSKLYAIELFVNSQQKWDKTRDAVAAGLRRYGGHAVCLSASP